MNKKLLNYLHLHFIVFIWGFTAVLGKLITLDALPLVWYRMLIAAILIGIYIVVKGVSVTIDRKLIVYMVVGGILVALHWVTFFLAIKVSTVSVALATMSTSAFFAALLEPLFYKRKIIWYEIVLGLFVIGGLAIIFKVESQYSYGIIIALISSLLAVLFNLINGKLIHRSKATVISFYELGVGVLFLSIYLFITGQFRATFFEVSESDWLYIFLLASVCTAYAFIASVNVMRFISPYTVMLTINLEPVYGFLLAFAILGEDEKMSPLFYVGALIILLTVIGNGVIKNKAKLKSGISENRST